MFLDVSSHTEVALHVEASTTTVVKWVGRACDRRPAAGLEPIFDQLIGLGRDIVFDLTGLEHMSSSTLVVIMKFVKRLQGLGLAIEFRYDEAVSWQRMTFATLASLGAPRLSLAA